MIYTPGLEELFWYFTADEMKWVVAFQMLEASIATITFIFCVFNFWTIIIKQRRCKVVPLVVFYLLAMPLCVVRFYGAIWYFTTIFYYGIFAILEPPTLKAMIGIDQAWIMSELCIRISSNMKLLKIDPIMNRMSKDLQVKADR